MTQHLFSIDVDAHLKKAASHTFGSPAHYPVELVRAAFKRRARQVEIFIDRKSIRVEDNGRGLNRAALETLMKLMDPSEDTPDKESAVEALQTREGLGLLAIFAANPSRIVIENIDAHQTTQPADRLECSNRQFTLSHHCRRVEGTAITIYSKERDPDREKELLEIFCQSVSGSVRLNNRAIGGEPLLTRQMATIKLHRTEYIDGGQIGVPRNGTLCHLRLLDQGITWHHLTLPPQKGFIFDAAMEFTGEPSEITRNFIDHLSPHVFRLYQWLCKRYSTAAPYHQERIEELLFTHCRLTADISLIHQFAPFRLYRSDYAMDLSRLRERALKGELYAVPRKKENLLYNTGGSKTVLSLTREQADLLINNLGLPVCFLSPIARQSNGWRKFKYHTVQLIKQALHFILPTPKKILDSHGLTASEELFMNLLNGCITEKPELFPGMDASARAVMVASSYPFPNIWLESGSSEKNTALCLIRRGHPLIRKAVHAVQADPKNIELVIPLIQK